jgi:hypothetical protein
MISKIFRVESRYASGAVSCGVELEEDLGEVTRIAERLTVKINKPYQGLSQALAWEVATKLSSLGYDVEVPERPEEGVLPDQDYTMQFEDPIVESGEPTSE